MSTDAENAARQAVVSLLQSLTTPDGDRAKPVNWGKLDVPIAHAGRAITLPADPGQAPFLQR